MNLENLYWTLSNVSDETQIYVFQNRQFKCNATLKYLLENGMYCDEEIMKMNIAIYINNQIMALEIYF